MIDPMHNLFLGTAKQIMKNVWIDSQNPLMSENDLEKIQAKMDDVKAPSSIRRMPRKIANGYGGFTADQWKTWTIFFHLLPVGYIALRTLGSLAKLCYVLCFVLHSCNHRG